MVAPFISEPSKVFNIKRQIQGSSILSDKMLQLMTKISGLVNSFRSKIVKDKFHQLEKKIKKITCGPVLGFLGPVLP